VSSNSSGVNVFDCFTYPFNLPYGAFMLVLALFSTAVAVAMPGTEVAHWVGVLAIAWVGFGIIDRIAAGEPRGGFASGGFMRPLKYWVIVFAMNALVLRYARRYGYYAAVGIDAVMSLIWPIMIAQLAITSRLRSAFNAAEAFRIMSAASMAYCVVAVLSLVTDQLGYALDGVVYPEPPEDGEAPSPNIAAAFGYEWLMTYLGIVNFCLVGWFCRQARDVMAPEGAPSESLAAAPPRSAEARAKAAVPAPAPLTDADKLKIFRQRLALDAQYRPAPDEVLALARAARGAKDSTTAVAIVRGFDKANPGHADVPQVYFFSAQLMAEDLGDRDMARKILEHLLKRFPGHYIAREAKAYLDGLASTA
jgi:hypothetical protein